MNARLIRLCSLGSLALLLAACPSSETAEVPTDAPQVVEPGPVEMTAEAGEATETVGTFENVGGSTLEIGIHVPDGHAEWLEDVEPTDFAVDPGETADVELQAGCFEVVDDYTTELLVETNDPRAEDFTWDVQLSCEEPMAGDLVVSVEGLPGGVDADVMVTGPEDFSRELTETTTLEEVFPGDYEVVAGVAEDGDSWYEPEPEQQVVSVQRGGQSESTIDYEGVPGSLQIDVEGLPEDADPSIELLNDDDEVVTERPEDGFIDDLQPGQYLVSPETWEDELGTYQANPPSVTIVSEETTEVTVNYIGEAGDVVVDVDWLPEDDGLDHDLELVDEDGETADEIPQDGQAVASPGTYTVQVNRVGDGDLRDFDGQDVEDVVVESNEETQVEVVYELIVGELEVEITGSPVDGDVTVEGPGLEGDDGEIVETTTFDQLEPGTYDVTAAGVSDNGADYEAIVYDEDGDELDGDQIDVASDDERTATVEYEVVSGTLDVTVDWVDDHDQLYGGVDADIQIVGPDGFDEHLIDGAVFGDADPGDYTFSVDNAVEGPAEFSWSTDDLDGDEATVTSEETTDVTISYEVITGQLHVDADGLPDDQSVQAEIDGPDGFDASIQDETNFEEALPGDYDVDFLSVTETTDVTRVYRASPSSEIFGVDSGATTEATGDYAVQSGDLTVDIEMPAEDGAGENLEADFAIVDTDDDTVVHQFGADGPHVEDVELQPGIYDIELDQESLEDDWGNEFQFQGLDETIEIDSEQDHSREVSTRLPTEVTTEDDDSTIYGSLRATIDRVQPYSEITFADGLQNIELTEGVVSIERPLDVIGGGITVSLADDPQQTAGLFEVVVDDGQYDGDEVLFQNLELTDGDAAEGGAVKVSTDSVDTVFFEVDFIDNTATNEGGGAIYAEGLGGGIEVSVHHAEFSGNEATGGVGGAIATDEDVELEVVDSDFDNNQADAEGGALGVSGGLSGERLQLVDNHATNGGALATDGVVAIDEAHFDDNSATVVGGGIAVDEVGELSLERTLLEDNVAGTDGGGVYLEGDARLLNTTFSGNEGDQQDGGQGGALWIDAESATEILFTTFYRNRAAQGEGIWSNDADQVVMKGSLVHDNGTDNQIEGPEGFGGIGDGVAINSAGYNFVEDDSAYFDDEDTDIVDASTTLLSLQQSGDEFSATHAIENETEHGHTDIPADACRDLTDQVLKTDQRGSPRPSGAACSRGAWEFEANIEDFEATADVFDETFSSGSFDGVDDREWSYVDVRDAGSYPIDEEGARFETTGAHVETTETGGSVDSFSVQFRVAGDDVNERNIQLFVDDEPVERSQSVGLDGADDYTYVFEVDDIAETGDELRIENDSPDGDGDITIDNITWR